MTQADLNYEGSISISKRLMDVAKIRPYEKVQVVNINNGERFETYAITHEDDALTYGGHIGVNGAGARLVQPGDLLIIMSYATVDDVYLSENYEPIVLLTNKNGTITYGDMCVNCLYG